MSSSYSMDSRQHQQREVRGALGVALIMACRMLGLFMILPIFSIAATHLQASTPTLVGMALGAYGLTQALLQIPFGKLSDQFGRRPVIAFGLLMFIAGSILAATSHSIYSMIAARALQGAGAIGSTCLALLADMTRDEFRTRAMAMVGMSIGSSFSLAMVLGPIFYSHFGLAGIFYLTAVLGLAAIVCLFTALPKPPRIVASPVVISRQSMGLRRLLKNTDLLRLDFSIFAQHAILTACFLAVPHILTISLSLTEHQQVWFYLAVLVLAFLAMIPGVIYAEKQRKLRQVMQVCIVILMLCMLLCYVLPNKFWVVFIALWLFFTAFSLLEAILPSWVTKVAPLAQRGMAMGVYSSSQFLGIFVGGVAGGYMVTHFGVGAALWVAITLAVLWAVLAYGMQAVPYFTTQIFKLPPNVEASNSLQQRLQAMPGVSEVLCSAEEGLLYVKADKQQVDLSQLHRQVEAGTL